jgi:hypothetical protein
MSPTNELYAPLTGAYDHFNIHLFNGDLPPVIFTLQRKKHVMGFFAAKRWGNLQGETCSEISINPSYFATSRIIEVMQTLVHEMVHAWQHTLGTPSDGHYHNKEWARKMMDVGLMPSDTGEPGGNIVGRNMSDYIIKQGRFLSCAEKLLSNPSYKLQWIDRLALPKLHEPVIVDMQSTSASFAQRSVESIQAMVVDQSIVASLESHCNEQYPAMQASADRTLAADFFVREVVKKQTRSRYECPGCETKVYGKASLNIICADCDLPYV